jgi:hypothetical protein
MGVWNLNPSIVESPLFLEQGRFVSQKISFFKMLQHERSQIYIPMEQFILSFRNIRQPFYWSKECIEDRKNITKFMIEQLIRMWNNLMKFIGHSCQVLKLLTDYTND